MEERRNHGTNDFKAIERTSTAFQYSVQYGTLRKEKLIIQFILFRPFISLEKHCFEAFIFLGNCSGPWVISDEEGIKIYRYHKNISVSSFLSDLTKPDTAVSVVFSTELIQVKRIQDSRNKFICRFRVGVVCSLSICPLSSTMYHTNIESAEECFHFIIRLIHNYEINLW